MKLDKDPCLVKQKWKWDSFIFRDELLMQPQGHSQILHFPTTLDGPPALGPASSKPRGWTSSDSPSSCPGGKPCTVLLLECPFHRFSVGPLMSLLEQPEKYSQVKICMFSPGSEKTASPEGDLTGPSIREHLPQPHPKLSDAQVQQREPENPRI